jgi:TolA-binding protein
MLLLGLAACVARSEENTRKANTLLRVAATLQNDAQFEIAASAWKEFLKEFPSHSFAGRARYHLAICHDFNEDYQDAVDQFYKVLKEFPPTKDPRKSSTAMTDRIRRVVQLGLIACHMRLKQVDAAKKVAAALEKEFPNDKQIATHIADYLAGKLPKRLPGKSATTAAEPKSKPKKAN